MYLTISNENNNTKKTPKQKTTQYTFFLIFFKVW